jgi:glutathione synthase
MVDALLKDGYVIAQESLPAAEEGDVRLFMMNGRPLRVKGRYAAFKRVRHGDDIRSNMHAGGTVEKAIVTPEMLDICEMVRPKLVADGMFLVGLDIVGDKLMEINVFCPGGLDGMERLEGVNFSASVIEALERKCRYAKYYDRGFDNKTMATL